MRKPFKNSLKNTNAFTLVEVLISIFILTIGMMGILLFIVKTSSAIQLSKDLTLATIHADYIFEEMHSRTSLSNITSETWDVNSLDASLDTLENEVISVSYVDSASDPLNITVGVSWTDASRNYNINFITEMTK